MVKKKDDAPSESAPQPELHHHARARRRLMTALAAGGSVAVTGKVAPDKWNAPILQTVILPAHARTSIGIDPCCNQVSVLSCSATNIVAEDDDGADDPFTSDQVYQGGTTHVVDGFLCDMGDLALQATVTLSPEQAQCGNSVTVTFAGNLQDDADDGQGQATAVQSGQTIELGFDCNTADTGCLFNDASEDLQITFSHPCAEDCVISFRFNCSSGGG